jgi:geranylgeranyl diphosphate synthase type I
VSRTAVDARPLSDALDQAHRTVEPAMRAAVATLPPSVRRIAGYHLGWWDEDGSPMAGDGGKGIRPALVLLSAEAVGGSAASAVPAAVAVALAHDFSLIHDDVMDGDRMRRHRPTAWSVFGIGGAILAGDALLALACDVLAASGHPAAAGSARMLSAAVLALIDGQIADISFETRADVSLTECISMSEHKTGALVGCASALGAVFGGGSADQVAHMGRFGEHVGLAFQHADDLLGIWGDPAVTGKPVYSDLRNRKKSLPVVAALTGDGPGGPELLAAYTAEDPLSGARLAGAAEMIERAGGRAWSQDEIGRLLDRALGELEAARPLARPGADLTALAWLMAHRDH